MRVRTIIGVATLSVMLAGCGGFDPLDKIQDLDIMGSGKTPLQGERRAVFPEGTPGVPKGVPPELVKGYEPPAEAPPPPPVAEKERPKPRKVAARPKPKQPKAEPKATVRQQQAPAQQNAAWPQPQPQSQQQGAGAWPSQQQPQQPAQAAWPTPATIPGSQPTWPGQAAPR